MFFVSAYFICCNTENSHNHVFSEDWEFDEKTHWHSSVCCDVTDRSDEAVHIMGEWEESKSSCLEPGLKKRNCTVCNFSEEEEIPQNEHEFGEWEEIPATCIEKGMRFRKCLKCEETETEEFSETGLHDFCQWVEVPATCVLNAYKIRKCSVCEKEETEDISSELAEHTWEVEEIIEPTLKLNGRILNVCEVCGKSDIQEIPKLEPVSLEMLGALKRNGDTILFGFWPQSLKEDDVEIDVNVQNSEVSGAEYFLGSDGNWYAGCYENPAKEWSKTESGKRYVYSTGEEKVQSNENGRYLYFKVEPVQWRFYDKWNVMISEKAVVSGLQFFGEKDTVREFDGENIYSSDYEKSSVRAFLNGLSFPDTDTISAEYENRGFLFGAFTEKMRDLILVSEVENSALSTADYDGLLCMADGTGSVIGSTGKTTYYKIDYTCRNTMDRIFLPSIWELTNPEYGFTNMDDLCSERVKRPTDFAIASGAFIGDGTKASYCLTRSPYFKTSKGNQILKIHYSGKISSGYTYDKQVCLAPALRLKNLVE